MLRAENLAKRFGGVHAVRDVALEVASGTVHSIIGPNGAGKSTLLKALSGVQPASGKVVFQDQEIQALPPERRVALGMVQVPEGRQVFGPLSVEVNLRLGAYRRGRAHAEATLGRVYALFPVLAERRKQAAGTLSGGEQQMLALGRALMAEPRLLLLDEPSMGLAPRLVAEIFSAIRRLRAADTALLLVEQNAAAALAIADRGYVLETGRVVLAGTGAELLADASVRAAYLGL